MVNEAIEFNLRAISFDLLVFIFINLSHSSSKKTTHKSLHVRNRAIYKELNQ